MSTDLLDPAHEALELAGQALELASLAAAAAGYARNARAHNTQRAYTADWAAFATWCQHHGVAALPALPTTVCLYLTDQVAARSTATLRRRLVVIGQAHRAAGLEDPTRAPSVRAVWRGIARAHARPPVQKTPLVVEAMRAVLATLDDTPRGRRDRCLLLVGWGGALRRSEIVALDRRDVAIVDEGLVVTLRRGKTIAHGSERQVGIPRGARPEVCPVEAVLCWGECIPDRAVPLFRRVYDAGDVGTARLADRQVARIVKRVAARAGLEGDYSGHSLRAGFATAAARGGARIDQIMAQTGHRSPLMAQRYIRPLRLFEDNAAAVAAL